MAVNASSPAARTGSMHILPQHAIGEPKAEKHAPRRLSLQSSFEDQKVRAMEDRGFCESVRSRQEQTMTLVQSIARGVEDLEHSRISKVDGAEANSRGSPDSEEEEGAKGNETYSSSMFEVQKQLEQAKLVEAWKNMKLKGRRHQYQKPSNLFGNIIVSTLCHVQREEEIEGGAAINSLDDDSDVEDPAENSSSSESEDDFLAVDKKEIAFLAEETDSELRIRNANDAMRRAEELLSKIKVEERVHMLHDLNTWFASRLTVAMKEVKQTTTNTRPSSRVSRLTTSNGSFEKNSGEYEDPADELRASPQALEEALEMISATMSSKEIQKMIRLNNFGLKLSKYANHGKQKDGESDSDGESSEETVSQKRKLKDKSNRIDQAKKLKADLESIRKKAQERTTKITADTSYSDLLNILSDQQDEVAALQSAIELKKNRVDLLKNAFNVAATAINAKTLSDKKLTNIIGTLTKDQAMVELFEDIFSSLRGDRLKECLDTDADLFSKMREQADEDDDDDGNVQAFLDRLPSSKLQAGATLSGQTDPSEIQAQVDDVNRAVAILQGQNASLASLADTRKLAKLMLQYINNEMRYTRFWTAFDTVMPGTIAHVDDDDPKVGGELAISRKRRESRAKITGATLANLTDFLNKNFSSLVEAFQTFDRDGSGIVNCEDFEAGLQRLGFHKFEADTIFQALDGDGTGQVSEKQFAFLDHILGHGANREVRECLTAVHKAHSTATGMMAAMDPHGLGEIGKKGFEKVLQACGYSISDADSIYSQLVQGNGDGTLSTSEACLMWHVGALQPDDQGRVIVGRHDAGRTSSISKVNSWLGNAEAAVSEPQHVRYSTSAEPKHTTITPIAHSDPQRRIDEPKAHDHRTIMAAPPLLDESIVGASVGGTTGTAVAPLAVASPKPSRRNSKAANVNDTTTTAVTASGVASPKPSRRNSKAAESNKMLLESSAQSGKDNSDVSAVIEEAAASLATTTQINSEASEQPSHVNSHAQGIDHEDTQVAAADQRPHVRGQAQATDQEVAQMAKSDQPPHDGGQAEATDQEVARVAALEEEIARVRAAVAAKQKEASMVASRFDSQEETQERETQALSVATSHDDIQDEGQQRQNQASMQTSQDDVPDGIQERQEQTLVSTESQDDLQDEDNGSVQDIDLTEEMEDQRQTAELENEGLARELEEIERAIAFATAVKEENARLLSAKAPTLVVQEDAGQDAFSMMPADPIDIVVQESARKSVRVVSEDGSGNQHQKDTGMVDLVVGDNDESNGDVENVSMSPLKKLGKSKWKTALAKLAVANQVSRVLTAEQQRAKEKADEDMSLLMELHKEAAQLEEELAKVDDRIGIAKNASDGQSALKLLKQEAKGGKQPAPKKNQELWREVQRRQKELNNLRSAWHMEQKSAKHRVGAQKAAEKKSDDLDEPLPERSRQLSVTSLGDEIAGADPAATVLKAMKKFSNFRRRSILRRRTSAILEEGAEESFSSTKDVKEAGDERHNADKQAAGSRDALLEIVSNRMRSAAFEDNENRKTTPASSEPSASESDGHLLGLGLQVGRHVTNNEADGSRSKNLRKSFKLAASSLIASSRSQSKHQTSNDLVVGSTEKTSRPATSADKMHSVVQKALEEKRRNDRPDLAWAAAGLSVSNSAAPSAPPSRSQERRGTSKLENFKRATTSRQSHHGHHGAAITDPAEIAAHQLGLSVVKASISHQATSHE